MRYKLKDRTGFENSGIIVLRSSSKTDKSGSYYWFCKCKHCDAEFETRGSRLENLISCGCIHPNRRLTGQTRTLNCLLNQYKQRAKKAKLDWSLTDDQAIFFFSQNCVYCGAAPRKTKNVIVHSKKQRPNSKITEKEGEVKFNGIDRVDNSLGYTVGNCVSCCHICNNAKACMTLSEFEAWIEELIIFRGR